MKTSAVLFFLGLHALPALGQTLAPSPTESFGCVPHDDHWHCEGARSTTAGAVESSPPPAVTSATSEHPDEHTTTDSPGTGSLAPSPTESIGCVPHGDHWHCEGPAPVETGSSEAEAESSTTVAVTTTTTLATSTVTSSGAASGTGALQSTTTTTGGSPVVTAGAAAGPMIGAVPVFGLVVYAALGF
ncbi:hypothetical protein N656DRAFT_779460 [Canariomyces notabilis]|uniref:Uncharacterized protein n=1 Tax=Canariomyces notabilis TaxID=2074819 RepID=A0AAN6YSH2_9PEZI|nr:hypothetical protein N656DRAFT_779460 [Canariomyces arenarius]